MKKILFKALTLLLVLLLAYPMNGFARESQFTNKGSGPMYWSSVGYQYGRNDYIPESEWEANLNWVNNNLKSYGYTMVCDDGWGKSFQWVTTTGYRTRHDDSWQHDWTYWSSWLSARGMTLGVYTNPLWMTQAVAHDPDSRTKYFVTGTTTPVIDLMYYGGGYNWVNPDHPLAKTFIQGYINHFKTMGVKYLRIDFLSTFESVFGTAAYANVLNWIAEAAGNDMMISLVLPGNHNHAENEKKYGDMFRVGFDCIYGWVNLQRSFDGFITYADINDKGNVIMDGDFLQMKAYASDTERETAVSIFAMAGSPIAFIDQYNWNAGSTWWSNTEVNAMNQDGFAGKPFRFGDVDDPLSQCWKGQMSNGDWVVGLFNRGESAVTRSVNFATDLNISGSATVRDMWTHTDMGSMTSYSASIPAHGCKLLKITGTTNYWSSKELEYGKMIGACYVYLDDNASNRNAVGYIGTGSGVEVKNMAAATGITLTYATPNATQMSVYVNDDDAGNISLPATGGWNTYSTAELTVNVPAGATIRIMSDPGDGTANLDKLTMGGSGGGGGQLTGKVEAESATKLGGANVYSDGAASGGQGIGYISYAGDGIQFTNVAAQFSMTIHYATAVSNSKLSLFINGTFNQSITFPSTGAWTGTYADKAVTVTIPSGATVVIKNNGGTDVAANIDYVVFGGTGGDSTKWEAEAGVPFQPSGIYNDAVASNGQGVGYIGVNGGVYWQNAPAATSITIGYAVHGSGQLSLYINNVYQQKISFPNTGAWTGTGAYNTVTINQTIPAEALVTLRHDGGTDYATNIDYIIFSVEVEKMVSLQTSLISNNEQSAVLIYPNPVFNELKIQLNKDYHNPEVIFYNVIGQPVIRNKLTKGVNVISIEEKAKGPYFVQVSDDNQKIYSATIIKQ